ncbi:MAG: class II aldolase/adducin family protein, partial [Phenylobacterium sp.]|uniref:class II aldolase/adducin family protein n=1 Tax=Phenylobacterium sp. TaxID=1871053 RepID=UPI001A45440C
MAYDAPVQTEAEVRRDLAAVYRLAALEGWDDLIFTHISARVPGPEHHFLINPFGLRFCEVTASNLVKVGLDGQPVEPSPHPVNPAGFVIHSALHMARDDAQCVIHLHTDDGVAVAAQADGLLPLSQHA